MTRKRILLIIFIMLAISSCSQFKKSNDVIDVMISQECSIPCWRGITPGISTFDDSWNIVERMASTSNEPKEILPTYVENDAVRQRIEIIFEKVGVSVCGNSQGITTQIKFFSLSRHQWEAPQLKDFIEVYGEPDSIEICHDLMERRRAIVYIYYPQMYLMFDKILPIHGDSFEVPIEKDTRIDYITLLPQSYERPVYDFSFSWTGYGDVIIEPEKQSPESICKILFP